MQTETLFYQRAGLPGAIDQTGPIETERMQTAYTGQVTRLTIGNGPYVATTYSVEVEVVAGYEPVFVYDGSAAADATAAATAFIAAWNADPQFRQLGTASSGGAGLVDIAWADYNRSWTVNLSTGVAATFTAAVQTAAASTTARFGVFCKRGAALADPRAARPFAPLESGDTIAVVRGFVIREDAGVEQPGFDLSPSSFDYYPAGRAVPVCNRGRGWVVCETAMALTDTPFVRITGSGIIGALRNDNAGGDAIDASTIVAIEAAGEAGGVCKVKVSRTL
jgi:hypothetical protein